MIHERDLKNEPLHTILYEIDMLRHCARTLSDKQAARFKSDVTRGEYNLVIEGFLLHLRNLLAFFTNRRHRRHGNAVDLIIADTRWAGEDVPEKECEPFTDRARKFDSEFGENGESCYDQISNYLQHCTSVRHEGAKGWNIETMFAAIEPLLADFVRQFGAAGRPRVTAAEMLGDSNTTASFTQTPFPEPLPARKG